jgi:hypothetical protein
MTMMSSKTPRDVVFHRPTELESDQARLNRAAARTAMMQVMPTMPVVVASLEGTEVEVATADVAVR